MENVTDKVSVDARCESITKITGTNAFTTDLQRLLAQVAEQAYIAGMNKLSIVSNQTTILDKCDVGASHVLVTNYLKDKGFIQ